jgi:hypothetical protein
LVLLAAVVLPASHAMTKLLVSYVFACYTQLGLIPFPGRAVNLLCALWTCTPMVFKEQILYLVKYTQWCNGKVFALVWE